MLALQGPWLKCDSLTLRGRCSGATNSHDGFRNHIRKEHNMWTYLYFIIFILEQDRDDDDGLELYVRKCFLQDEIAFFPVDRAMSLEAK